MTGPRATTVNIALTVHIFCVAIPYLYVNSRGGTVRCHITLTSARTPTLSCHPVPVCASTRKFNSVSGYLGNSVYQDFACGYVHGNSADPWISAYARISTYRCIYFMDISVHFIISIDSRNFRIKILLHSFKNFFSIFQMLYTDSNTPHI